MKQICISIIIFIMLFSGLSVKALSFETIMLEDDNGTLKDPYENGYVSSNSKEKDFTCQTILIKENGEPTEFKKILDSFFGIIQLLAPLIAIVLTIIDYYKTLISSENTKKVNSRTIKRIVIATLIVFLPLLLDLLFHMFGSYDLSTCKIGR